MGLWDSQGQFKPTRKKIFFFIPLLTIILVFIVSKAKADVYVHDTEELLDAFYSNSGEAIVIERDIYISESIEIAPEENNVISLSANKAIIETTNPLVILTFKNLQYLEIRNITINGHIAVNDTTTVLIQNSNLRGAVVGERNSKVNIQNCVYTSDSQFSEVNRIDFKGGQVSLLNTNFFAHKTVNGTLFQYEGDPSALEDVQVMNCRFDGNFISNSIYAIYARLTVLSSRFFNGFASVHGGVMDVQYSEVKVENCTMTNSYSDYSGGVFYANNNLSFDVANVQAYNATARRAGSFLLMYSSNPDKVMSLDRVTLINFWERNPSVGDSIIFLMTYTNIRITNLHVEGFYCPEAECATFFLIDKARMTLYDSTIKNMYGGKDGTLIFYFMGDETKQIMVDVFNCKILNIGQSKNQGSKLILYAGKSKVSLRNMLIDGISMDYGNLFYTQQDVKLTLNNIEIDNVKNLGETIVINTDKSTTTNINGFTIRNSFFTGVLVSTDSTDVSIKNFEVQNLNNCPENKNYEECIKLQQLLMDGDTNIAFTTNFGSITLSNIVMNNIYFNTLFNYGSQSKIVVENMRLSNGHFKNGVINTGRTGRNGRITIKDSVFDQIESIYGTFMYDSYNLGSKKPVNTNSNVMVFENVQVQNINTNNKGGIVYSTNPKGSSLYSFRDCKFTNITTSTGQICHSFGKGSEPYFSNKKELLNQFGNLSFTTNPTVFEVEDAYSNGLKILSGETIRDHIRFYLKDDYGHVNQIISDTDYLELEDLIFFTVDIDDQSNTALFGHKNGYCWNGSCDIFNIRIVGNPGTYNLRLHLITFGQYDSFPNSVASVKVKIMECPNVNNGTYILKDTDHVNLKSCYIPTCNPQCKTGRCVNDNVCDCKDTNFRGPYCSDRIPLKRNSFIDFFISVSSIASIGFSILCIILTLKYKNKKTIKAGSIDFLIIILFGLILSSLYSLCLAQPRSKLSCILIRIFKHQGFSLVYGSLLVKSLRVYQIFKVVKNRVGGIVSSKTLYGIVLGLSSIHLFLVGIGLIRGDIDVIVTYDKNEFEYSTCKLPEFDIICNVINIGVIFISSVLAFSIRNIEREFKEPLTVPIYVYMMLFIFINFSDYQNDVPLIFKDLINAGGSIFSVLTVLYFLYFKKFAFMFANENGVNESQVIMINIENDDNSVVSNNTSGTKLNFSYTKLNFSHSKLNHLYKPSNAGSIRLNSTSSVKSNMSTPDLHKFREGSHSIFNNSSFNRLPPSNHIFNDSFSRLPPPSCHVYNDSFSRLPPSSPSAHENNDSFTKLPASHLASDDSFTKLPNLVFDDSKLVPDFDDLVPDSDSDSEPEFDELSIDNDNTLLCNPKKKSKKKNKKFRKSKKPKKEKEDENPEETENKKGSIQNLVEKFRKSKGYSRLD